MGVRRGSYSTNLWKEIRNEWETLLPRVGYVVGNGRRVQFWKDAWCGETAFYSMFPSLFSLVVHKEASVANVWDSSRELRGGPPSSLGRLIIGI